MADEPDELPPPPQCVDALSEVMGMYRYEMTSFEGGIWKRIMGSVPPDRFLRFLQHFVATSKGFPPKPNDATKALELTIDPDGAYARIERLVKEHGPYQEPAIADPVLVTAIVYMGGWVTLNEQMPDPSNGFALKNFRDRFDACFNQAVNAVRIAGQMPERPLLSLASPRPAPQPALEHQSVARIARDDGDRPAPLPRHSRFGSSPT